MQCALGSQRRVLSLMVYRAALDSKLLEFVGPGAPLSSLSPSEAHRQFGVGVKHPE